MNRNTNKHFQYLYSNTKTHCRDFQVQPEEVVRVQILLTVHENSKQKYPIVKYSSTLKHFTSPTVLILSPKTLKKLIFHKVCNHSGKIVVR